MEYARLGGTGIEVSRLGLGTMGCGALGGGPGRGQGPPPQGAAIHAG